MNVIETVKMSMEIQEPEMVGILQTWNYCIQGEAYKRGKQYLECQDIKIKSQDTEMYNFSEGCLKFSQLGVRYQK